MPIHRLIADYDLLDVLRRLIEEKELDIAPDSYRRVIEAVATALCEEFECSLNYVTVDDEPGASIHLYDYQQDSLWSCYGDIEV